MSTRAYRIEVTRWPTEDGKPWSRFYGPGAAAPDHKIPDWLARLVDEAMPLIYAYRDPSGPGRIARRIRYDDDRDELRGVIMPKPKRATYLSASGVAELAADMRAFGAEATVLQSEPITWPDTEGTEDA